MKEFIVSEAPFSRIVQIDYEDLFFSYDNSCTVKLESTIKTWPHSEKVDPWGPCYIHDIELIKKTLQSCVKKAPLKNIPVSLFVSSFESESRSNGMAWEEDEYYNKELIEKWTGPGKNPWEGMIFLSGKRTEIHPAYTRYVVPHEYGHLVEYYLEKIRYPDSENIDVIKDEYAKLRGIDRNIPYKAGNHHLVVGEVMANDFRTYVMEAETEFWPHEVKPPWKLKRIQRWWDEAISELKNYA